MRPIWAILSAIAVVVFAIAVMVVVLRIARRKDSQAGVGLPDVVVALLALAATVYFGVKAQDPTENVPPNPDASTVAESTAYDRSPQGTTTPTRVSRDVVKIANLTNRPGVVEVTVRVSGPPSPGTRYLLVVHHNGGYQLKGTIDATIGEHVIEADVRLAAPGSWRDFFVVGADARATEAWEGTIQKSSIEVPVGSRELTQRMQHQMPP